MEEMQRSPDILAFDVGGTRIKAGVAHDGNVLLPQIIDVGDGEDILGRMEQLGRQLMEGRAIQYIGMAIRGIVDPRTGVLLEVNGPFSQYIGQPLAPLLAARLQRPTFIENDARMYALGEYLYGAGRGTQSMVCVTLGTGVGCGVVLEGQLLRGPRGVAGILGGHITIQADGPICTCGNRGCLEALIGTQALVQSIQDVIATGTPTLLREGPADPLHLFQAMERGDAQAQAIVARFVVHLGAGIVSLIHVFDPDRVVVGGGIAHSAPLFLDAVQQYVDAHAWTIPRKRVRLVPAQLGDIAALLGNAAYLDTNASML